MGVSYVVAFGGGIASFVSPCVLPVVPGYLSMITGLDASTVAGQRRARQAVVAPGELAAAGAAGGAVDIGAAGYVPVRAAGAGSTDIREGAGRPGAPSLARIARDTCLFILGFGTVFVLLGLVTTAAGDALIRDKRMLTQISGGVVLAMALFLAGSLVLSLPGLYREARWHPSPARLGPFAAPVTGVAFGLGWTPCIGPVLASVLAFASTGRNVGQSAALLAVYTLGLGLPFLVVGLALGRLAGALAVVRRHLRGITVASALSMAGFGVLLLLDKLTWLTAELQTAFTAVGLGSLVHAG